MAVAIIHYHLSAGGVTRVIEETSRCLTDGGMPHIVLTGSGPACGDLPFHVIEGLGYQRESDGPTSIELIRQMRAAVESILGPGPHVWHFHNHSLGVNVRMAELVAILAGEGERLVLQLHDLAEDGRPGNHPLLADSEMPYPFAPQIRYAFLNSRDRDRFTAAGLPETQSMLLPNPIRIPDSAPPPASTPARVLYAVRGIRRKNLGEVFLLASLSPTGTRYATTLAPTQKRWLPVFEKWQAFAMSSGLPVDLAVVGRIATASGDSSFDAWQSQATHFVTTSVAEGFGLAFLEAVAVGKPLLGRDLPTITRDYVAQGIKAGHLYERLLIPASWIDPERLRQHLTNALQNLMEAYGRDLSSGFVEEVSDAMRFNRHLDFGNLPEDLQQLALQHLLDASAADDVLVEIAGERFPAVEWLGKTLAERTPTATAGQLAHYSPESHLMRLAGLHDELLATTPQTPSFLPKHRVLSQYLRPENFHFLLT
jgi:hypothetical protein